MGLWDTIVNTASEVVDEGKQWVGEKEAAVTEWVGEKEAAVTEWVGEKEAAVTEWASEKEAAVTAVATNVVNYINPSNLYEDQGVESQYRLSPTNPAFVDAELSSQDMANDYHLEYNENGILWRVKASGEPHPEDLIKYYQQLEYKGSKVGKPILDKINSFLDFVDDVSTANLMTPVLPVDAAAVVGKGFAFAGKGIIKGGEAIIRAEKAAEVVKVPSNAAGLSFKTGKDGEKYLAKIVGGDPQVYFKTGNGGRYIDQLANGVGYESKVGYTTRTEFVKNQVLKDTELIKTGQIVGAEWNFFRSDITGKVGASKPLIEFLDKSGIKYIIHE